MCTCARAPLNSYHKKLLQTGAIKIANGQAHAHTLSPKRNENEQQQQQN